MKVAIIQPNYIPWKGYFDIIHAIDTFIFLDDVQYTTRDWRNRNKIKTTDGSTIWLSVPTLGGRNQRICDVGIDHTQGWQRKHCESLRHNYRGAPFFEDYFERFSDVVTRDWKLLVDLDMELTREVSTWLGMDRRFLRSSELQPRGSKDERLIDLVKKVGGTYYLSGPAARDYIEPQRFADAGVELAYHDYSGYPEYPQISDPFDHYVSVLDLLFAVGDAAPEYIWGAKRVRG